MHGIQNAWWLHNHVNVKPVSRRPWFPRDLEEAQGVLFHNLPQDGPALAKDVPAINANGLIVVDTVAVDPDRDLFPQVVWPWFKRILVEGWTPGFVLVEVEGQWFVRVYGPITTASEVERDRA